jgi:hypothetical protein
MKQMRWLLVSLLSILILDTNAQNSNSQSPEIVLNANDSILYNRLLKMDFNLYYNKPISVFLKSINGDYSKYFAHTKKPGLLDYISFKYSDSLTIEIRVKKYKYLKRLDYDYKWSIEEFKKEKLYEACLKYAGKCIKGCNLSNCD